MSTKSMSVRLVLGVACLAAGAVRPAPAQQMPDAALKQFYEDGLKRNGIVGSGLVLIRNGEVVGSDYYGDARRDTHTPVTARTAFHWASITKTFTAIAILQLRDRGLLKLDDPVLKYVPELAAVHDAWGPVNAITIRHLLTHSGGFRAATWPWVDDQPWEPFEPAQWSQIVAMLPYTDVMFQPGSRFSYSNLGIVFLGQIIERLSGDPYAVYIDKNILKPLEMYASYFNRAPYFLLKDRAASYELDHGTLTERPFDFDTGITVSNGGLNAPLADMTKYIQFLLGDPARAARYDEVLKRSSLEEMFQPELKIAARDPNAAPNAPDERDSLGLSCFVRDDHGRRFVGHSGNQNGFISHFFIEPATRSAYIVNFNTDEPQQSTSAFDRDLRDYLFEHFFPAAKRP